MTEAQFIVAATGHNGREFGTREFYTREDAVAHLNLPGIAYGTVYRRYLGGPVEYSTNPDIDLD